MVDPLPTSPPFRLVFPSEQKHSQMAEKDGAKTHHLREALLIIYFRQQRGLHVFAS